MKHWNKAFEQIQIYWFPLCTSNWTEILYTNWPDVNLWSITSLFNISVHNPQLMNNHLAFFWKMNSFGRKTWRCSIKAKTAIRRLAGWPVLIKFHRFFSSLLSVWWPMPFCCIFCNRIKTDFIISGFGIKIGRKPWHWSVAFICSFK